MNRLDNAGDREPIPVLVPTLPSADELLPFLRRIDAAHWYSNHGPLWREFAYGLAGFLGDRAGRSDVGVTFTSSGTTAIELALRIRARPGARFCLMPSFTFIASAHAVCNAGLIPFLVDVDEKSMVLTPAIAALALQEISETPAAVLVISAFGAPPDVAAWEEFERTHGVPVVFDAAAALTSLDMIGNQPLCVSLHATKVFGIGEGGAIISADPALIARTTAMTGFGFGPGAGSRVSEMRGGNYRISEYAAAVGLATLAGIERKIAMLKTLGGAYASGLRNGPVRLQEGAGEQWVTMTLNVILPPDQVEETLARLDEERVEWRRWWGLGCHTHPAFADLPSADLGTTRDLAPRVIGVPFHARLTPEQIARACACLTGGLS